MKINIPGTQLYRDTENMALISRDINGLSAYKAKRLVLMNQKNEMETLKKDVCIIKELLLKLTGSNNG